eukprot:12145-Heterococcus_DN1.PRE.2
MQCSKQFQIAQQPRAGALKRCVPIGKQRQLHYASFVALMVLAYHRSAADSERGYAKQSRERVCSKYELIFVVMNSQHTHALAIAAGNYIAVSHHCTHCVASAQQLHCVAAMHTALMRAAVLAAVQCSATANDVEHKCAQRVSTLLSSLLLKGYQSCDDQHNCSVLAVPLQLQLAQMLAVGFARHCPLADTMVVTPLLLRHQAALRAVSAPSAVAQPKMLLQQPSLLLQQQHSEQHRTNAELLPQHHFGISALLAFTLCQPSYC